MDVKVIDLKSGHGTFVGEEELQPHEPKALANGDVIRFGSSSRTYVVRGVGQQEKDVNEDIQSLPTSFGARGDGNKQRKSLEEERRKV